MLEVLHVLADHEQVILPLVDDFEFLNGLAVAGIISALLTAMLSLNDLAV